MSSNICLHHLALVDVLLSLRKRNDDYLGNVTWLMKLEEKAVSENLPGILGKSLLLKAELFMSHGENQAAQEVLRQLKVLAQQPGLDFLKHQLQRISRE